MTGESSRQDAPKRRTRVLLALEDGEIRVSAIAAWADLSERQTHADLTWLWRNKFASTDGLNWELADAGREHLASVSDQEKDDAWGGDDAR